MWIAGLVFIALGVIFFLVREPLDRWNADTSMKWQVGPAKNEDLGRRGSYVPYLVTAAAGFVLAGVVFVLADLV